MSVTMTTKHMAKRLGMTFGTRSLSGLAAQDRWQQLIKDANTIKVEKPTRERNASEQAKIWQQMIKEANTIGGRPSATTATAKKSEAKVTVKGSTHVGM